MTLIRPFGPGMSISTTTDGPGTITVIARRTNPSDSRRFAVSCAHVLARFGLNVSDPKTVAVVQPRDEEAGSFDERHVGNLSEFFTRGEKFKDNHEDIALAQLLPSGPEWTPELPAIGPPASWQKSFANNQKLWWYGATSTLVEDSQVLGPAHDSLPLKLPGFQAQTFRFTGLYRFKPRPAPGDSGAALLIKGTRDVIGMVVGMHPSDNSGYFFPIAPLFSSYGLELHL